MAINQSSHSIQNKWTNRQCAFLSFFLIYNTSAFDYINLLSYANEIYLNPNKLTQDEIVNHLMLKNPWALDTFLDADQIKMYTWDKIVIFRNFCSLPSLF